MEHHITLAGKPVLALGYGAGSLGTALTGAAAERHIGAFLDAGGTFFDTAHCYAFWVPGGLGASERELGRVLKVLGARERCVVATKGCHPHFDDRYARPADFLAADVLERDVTESLERLGVETIDLYFLHRDDGATPVGDILERLVRQVERGRIRHFATSNWSVARQSEARALAERHGITGFVASQVQGSLAVPTWQPTADPTTRYLDEPTLAWHVNTQLPIVAYSATASGYFAGRPSAENLYGSPENALRRERARDLAQWKNATATQIAVAYLRHVQAPVLPLVGTTSESHLAELLGGLSVELSLEDLAYLRGE